MKRSWTEAQRRWQGRIVPAWKKFLKTPDGQRAKREIRKHDYILWHSWIGNSDGEND